MDRRVFLGAMAAGATATALQATAATTERPLGETGVPLQGSEPLPRLQYRGVDLRRPCAAGGNVADFRPGGRAII